MKALQHMPVGDVDVFSGADAARLAAESEGPQVSIFLPTERRGDKTHQAAIRLRNLLADARRQLRDAGMSTREIDDLLAPEHALALDDEDRAKLLTIAQRSIDKSCTVGRTLKAGAQIPDAQFEQPAEGESPRSSHHVVEHQNRHAAQPHAGPENERHQIRPKKLRPVGESQGDGEPQEHYACHQRSLLDAVVLGRKRIVHWLFSSFVRSFSGTSSSVACWLNCSARM